MTLLEVRNLFFVKGTDSDKRLACEIEFRGPGWYSLDDDGVFRKGRSATYCRIRIEPVALKDKIPFNRIREARRDRAEKVLRQVRQRVFDYEDEGKGEKAQRVMATCKRIAMPRWEAQADARAASRLMNYHM